MSKPPTLALVLVALVAVVLPAGAAVGEETGRPVAAASAGPTGPTPTGPTPTGPTPTGPTPTGPTPTETTPADGDDGAGEDEDVPDDAPRIGVEERVSVSQLRHLGVTLSGANLPPGTDLSLTLDGRPVRQVTTSDDGTFDGVRVRFATIAPGDHALALVLDGEEVATDDLDVQDDFFEVTASPRWVTAQTLRTSGARLRVGAEHRSYTMDQDFDAVVVHRAADGTVDEVPVGRGSTRRDGTVDVTITGDADDFPGGPGTVHSVCLRSDFLPFLFSCTELRVTALTISRSDDGRTVTGTGFEPGSTVDLVVDGERVAGTTARDDASVSLALDTLALDTITLRSAAGEARLGVPPLPAQARELAQTLKERAALVSTIRSTSGVLASAVGPESVGKAFTSAQTAALQTQVEAQEKLLGAYPARPLADGKGTAFVPGPGINGLGSATGDWRVSAGSTISYDAGAAQAARDKYLEADGARDAARAQQLEQLAIVDKYVEDAMKNLLISITTFIKELVDSQVQKMRAVTRASTPTVVARQPVGLDSVVGVAIPADFRGRHHIAVIDPATGFVTAWQPVDVVAGESAGGGRGTPGAATTATLPDTGAEVGRELLPLGLALVLAGAATVVLGRRRRA